MLMELGADFSVTGENGFGALGYALAGRHSVSIVHIEGSGAGRQFDEANAMGATVHAVSFVASTLAERP
jgi:hypothetical protein